MKSLKLSNYFELVYPKYKYIEIISHKSIKNYSSDNISKTISNTYISLEKRIRREGKKIFFKTSFKISFLLDIQNNDCKFYFIVPGPFLNVLLEKIAEIWSKATITVLDENPIKEVSKDAEMYQLSYKKEDALSLKVDKKSNEPLNSVLSVMDILKEEDRILIAYNFIPCSNFGWKERYCTTLDKIKNNKLIDKKHITLEYVFKSSIMFILKAIDDALRVIDDFTGQTNQQEKQSLYEAMLYHLEDRKELSSSTKKKKDSNIIDTQIAIFSESTDQVRKNDNVLSVCQSYSVLDEDNELMYKRVKSKTRNNFISIDQTNFGIDINTLSTDEVASTCLQIPGRTLLTQLGINYIDTTETEVPQELRDGVMCIGTNTYKGIKQKAYLSTDKDFRNLVTCIIGPNRAGKTNLLKHFSLDAINSGECVFLFDFCGQCEFSEDVKKVISKNKILNIDCSDLNNLQGLGYNEVFTNSNNPFEIYNSAKQQTAQLVSFINSINVNNPLEPRMNRYLKAAALIVFINKGSFKDVFNVLQHHVARKTYLDKIPKDQLENLEEYILTLKELDEWSKETKDNSKEIIGTKVSFVQGILNRLDSIKSNSYMELMLKKDCKNNINLVEEMQKPQLICLKMPETMFNTDEEKDTYCTYWLTKIWGALQQRHSILKEDDRVKVNVFFDELYQVINCQTLLKTKLNQIAKKTCKPIISCHSLEQIKYIAPELKNASTSYIIISGSNKQNYLELKEELEPYELEDLLNLKRFYSLNLIKCNNGYSKFITELPHLF